MVLDGEIVAYDTHGVTSFPSLQSGGRPTFLAFDVLHLDGGVSLQRKTYGDRRRVLELLGAAAPGLQVPETLSGDGAVALEQSIDRGWEGVVAKRRDSVYLPGKRGTAWIKAKNWLTQEVVVGGDTARDRCPRGHVRCVVARGGPRGGDDLVFVGVSVPDSTTVLSPR